MTIQEIGRSGRNQQWLDIWQKKYNKTKKVADLHVLDGYDGLSADEWHRLTHYFLDRLGIDERHDVLEVGCGCGAFLSEIGSCRSLSGVDYSANAIRVAQENLSGTFVAAEAAALPFADQSFDFALSFGVFFYFDSLDYARRAFTEMVRVLRPGGTLFIGEVNDLAKRDVAEQLRRDSGEARAAKYVSKSNPDHIYYSKEFFRQLANEHGLRAEFYDEDVPELAFYYNGPYRFSVSMLS